MSPRETEYTALRAEIVHYDTACLTILGSLLTASAAIYGVVVNKDSHSPHPLLFLLSIIWAIGFLYMLDKRASILRIALYIRRNFESSNNGCYWESWLQNDGTYLPNQKQCLHPDITLKYLPTIDPVRSEFVLLLLVSFVDTAWLWGELDEFTNDPQTYLAMSATVFSIISVLYSIKKMNSYFRFLKKMKNAEIGPC